MAKQNTTRIGKRQAEKPVSRLDRLNDTWTVMKPFVQFSVKALKIVAHALIFIVKQLPKSEERKAPSGKSTRIIKI